MKVSIIFLGLPRWIISPEAGPDQHLKHREISAEAADFGRYLASRRIAADGRQFDTTIAPFRGSRTAHATGADEEIDAVFMQAYRIRRARIEAFLALPLAGLQNDCARLKTEVNRIGTLLP